MVSRKSERLVNLVIALLATKRYLTKSEIFRTIEGYEGSNDSMERMFERDKDELRSLGIDIEVSSLDPLFDDEIGYRIRSENFVMNYSQLTPSEIAYMSLGAQVWKDAILSEVAQKALRKLIGLAKPADITEIPTFAPTVLNAPNFLSELVECISSRRPIEFTYIDGELNANKRNINVYSYFSLKGFWYFSGYDLAKLDIRTFRCDRVTGDIHLSKKTQCYDIPDDYVTDFNFQVLDQSQNAQLRIRHGRGTQLRSIATKIEHGEEFDLIDLSFASDDSLVPIILWHLDDVVVVNPDSLKQSVVASLRNLATSHG